MGSPPPVPPKDITASRSKRKRTQNDDDPNEIHELRDGFTYTDDTQSHHTPKRSKSHVNQDTSDVSGNISESEAPSTSHHKGLRRKKGVNNLSNVNLRQEAKSQRNSPPPPLPGRGSKFKEGSLQDKPSEKPPSAFTRFTRTDSGNIQQVDRLMEDYHRGSEDTGPTSTPAIIEQNIATMDQDVNSINHTATEDEDRHRSKGLFGWGDGFKFNFRPVSIWKKVWSDTKDDLARKNAEELERKKQEEAAARAKEEEERKAQQKAEAEARYAEMKASGQFAYTPVGHYRSQASTTAYGGATHDDRPLMDRARNPSQGSHLTLPQTDVGSRTSSEAPQSFASSSKTLKNRLSTTFRKPSMFNLKSAFSNDLKRVRSEYNIAANQSRDSTTSLSPIKSNTSQQQHEHDAPEDLPSLKPTKSKADLRKQHKLSKRVSDLEGKLQLARRELDDALVQASPMPKLSNHYERFTPTPGSTIKRPKVRPRFTGGGLPSLPSERLLFADEMEKKRQDQDVHMRDADDHAHAGAEFTEPVLTESMIATSNNHLPLDPSELMPDFEDGEETIRGRSRASRPVNRYPARVSSLSLGLPETTTTITGDSTSFHNSDNNLDNNDPIYSLPATQDSELTPFTSDALVTDQADNNLTMDPNFKPSNEAFTPSQSRSEAPTNPTTSAALDAKLKALDASVKAAAKEKKNRPSTKKRKSIGDEDKAFKPDNAGEDSEEEAGTPRRKKTKRAVGKKGKKSGTDATGGESAKTAVKKAGAKAAKTVGPGPGTDDGSSSRRSSHDNDDASLAGSELIGQAITFGSSRDGSTALSPLETARPLSYAGPFDALPREGQGRGMGEEMENADGAPGAVAQGSRSGSELGVVVEEPELEGGGGGIGAQMRRRIAGVDDDGDAEARRASKRGGVVFGDEIIVAGDGTGGMSGFGHSEEGGVGEGGKTDLAGELELGSQQAGRAVVKEAFEWPEDVF
ncbi:hypothetical protein MBLNU230_g6491t1 [Neophaeotheca triangularis]